MACSNSNATGAPARVVTPGYCHAQQYRPPTRTPLSVGEARPKHARTAKVQRNRHSEIASLWPDQKLLSELASAGYPAPAILCAAIRGHRPIQTGNGARKVGASGHVRQEWDKGVGIEIINVAHPFAPSAPTRRTTHGGNLTPAQVSAALAQMRVEANMQGALFEVLVKRQPIPQVSAARGLNPQTLKSTVGRVRSRILFR